MVRNLSDSKSDSGRPLHDEGRLKALAQSGLMDTDPEPVFDRAVRLATRLLGAPVGLLSLVDGERQFFKAQIGLAEPAATARQTPLSHSFCQHVVDNDAPLVVTDAREDERLRDNPAVPDMNVIAYLGIPVHDSDGNVLGSLCAIEGRARKWTDDERETLADIAAGVEAEIALREQLQRAELMEERLRLALMAGRVGTYDFDPRTGASSWDEGLHKIWGLPHDTPDLFTAATERIHPADLAMVEANRNAAFDPEGDGRHDVELRVVDPDTGDVRWVHADGTVTFEDGVAVRMVGTVRDITDRKLADERSSLLTKELNHRVKNLFAVFSGLISLTARTSVTPKQMGEALRARVQALASAHALVQPAISGERIETTKATFQTLAATILEPHVQDVERVTLTGPSFPLRHKAASSLALVFHELATNSAKYGALSSSDGKLAISWRLDKPEGIAQDNDIETRTLHIEWSETEGPAIEKVPKSKGFGSTLIDMTVRAQMLGTLETEWRETGVVHNFALPLARIQS